MLLVEPLLCWLKTSNLVGWCQIVVSFWSLEILLCCLYSIVDHMTYAYIFVLCFVVVILSVPGGILRLTYPCSSRLLHWNWGNHQSHISSTNTSGVILKDMGIIYMCQATITHSWTWTVHLYDDSSASKVTLEDMGKIYQYQTTTKHKKVWSVCIFHGMYSACLVLSVL